MTTRSHQFLVKTKNWIIKYETSSADYPKLIVAGFLYSLAGPEEEWGSIPIIGIIIVAAFIPWEILFIGRRKNKPKK